MHIYEFADRCEWLCVYACVRVCVYVCTGGQYDVGEMREAEEWGITDVSNWEGKLDTNYEKHYN